MISIRLVEFSGSGSWSVLSRRKRRGTPDVTTSTTTLLKGVNLNFRAWIQGLVKGVR